MQPKFKDIPPPPEKPDPLECCGSGCIPCILDYYELKLQEWEQKYECRLRDYQHRINAHPDSQTISQDD